MENTKGTVLSNSEVTSRLFQACQGREPLSEEEANNHLKNCQPCTYRMFQRSIFVRDILPSLLQAH